MDTAPPAPVSRMCREFAGGRRERRQPFVSSPRWQFILFVAEEGEKESKPLTRQRRRGGGVWRERSEDRSNLASFFSETVSFFSILAFPHPHRGILLRPLLMLPTSISLPLFCDLCSGCGAALANQPRDPGRIGGKEEEKLCQNIPLSLSLPGTGKSSGEGVGRPTPSGRSWSACAPPPPAPRR